MAATSMTKTLNSRAVFGCRQNDRETFVSSRIADWEGDPAERAQLYNCRRARGERHLLRAKPGRYLHPADHSIFRKLRRSKPNNQHRYAIILAGNLQRDAR